MSSVIKILETKPLFLPNGGLKCGTCTEKLSWAFPGPPTVLNHGTGDCKQYSSILTQIISTFLSSLMKEWTFVQANIDMVLRSDLKKIKRTMTKKEIEREERIKNTALDINSFPNYIEYLRTMANVTKKI